MAAETPAPVRAALADVVVAACAEAFRGDGEIFASGMGTVPMLAARLARATFEPRLLVSDGEAFFVTGDLPIASTAKTVEGYIPFRRVFETVWAGRRHVMMGASQVDRFGNTNIANVGDWRRPKAQLLGVRGAPGNTVSHATSYFVPNHSRRVFVGAVDMVSGLGYDRAAAVSEIVERQHRIPRIVTNLAVLDFDTPDHSMRLVSVHPGVTVDDVADATGFDLARSEHTPETPAPDAAALEVLDRLDPDGLRHREIPTP